MCDGEQGESVGVKGEPGGVRRGSSIASLSSPSSACACVV